MLKPIPITAQTEDGKKSATILIYEPIGGDFFGFGLNAKSFAEDLKALGELDEIIVRINSPGGAVHDGLAIFNTLVAHPAEVVVHIDGIAASAASFVAQSASPGELNMAENALMMIHLAQGLTLGDRNDHLKTAEILEQHDSVIAGTYAARAGRKPKEFMKLMEIESWFDARQAKTEGLIDTVTEARKEAASLDGAVLNRFHNIPPELLARLAAQRRERESVQARQQEKEKVRARLRMLGLDA